MKGKRVSQAQKGEVKSATYVVELCKKRIEREWRQGQYAMSGRLDEERTSLNLRRERHQYEIGKRGKRRTHLAPGTTNGKPW